MALNLEQIKALAPAVVAREVTIPEFNDSVWIGELTAWERESRVEQPFKARKEATGDLLAIVEGSHKRKPTDEPKQLDKKEKKEKKEKKKEKKEKKDKDKKEKKEKKEKKSKS